MAVITWQNIQPANNRDVFREFAGAQQGVTAGFDKLAEILKARETVNQGAADRARQASQEGYLNLLQGFKTPEELQAARMSGVLDQRLAELDPRNQAAVRNSAEARIAALQGQVAANDTYDIGQINAPVNKANAQAAAARAPGEQLLLNQGLLHRQTVQPLVDAAAVLGAQTNLAVATGTAARTPGEQGLLDRALQQRIAVQPTLDQTATLTAKNGLNTAQLTSDLATLTNSNTKSAAEEEANRLREIAQGRAVDAEVNSFVQNHQKTSSGARAAITSVAAGLGPKVVPMKPDGTLALDQMTDAQKESFNKVLTERGLPTLTTLETGDTKAKAQLLAGLQAKGYSVAHIARVAQGLDFSLNTGPIAPIGGDLSAFNAQIAKREALTARIENDYGVKAGPGNVGELLKGGINAIDAVVDKNSARSEIYKERLGQFLRSGGIPVKDPVTNAVTRVLPNADQIQMIVTGIEKKWHNTRFGGMQEEIDNALESWATSSEALKGAAELNRLGFVKDMQKIREAEEASPPIPRPPIPRALNPKK